MRSGSRPAGARVRVRPPLRLAAALEAAFDAALLARFAARAEDGGSSVPPSAASERTRRGADDDDDDDASPSARLGLTGAGAATGALASNVSASDGSKDDTVTLVKCSGVSYDVGAAMAEVTRGRETCSRETSPGPLTVVFLAVRLKTCAIDTQGA